MPTLPSINKCWALAVRNYAETDTNPSLVAERQSKDLERLRNIRKISNFGRDTA